MRQHYAQPPATALAAARIGPHSVLQLVPLLDATVGPEARRALLLDSGMADLPEDNGLMNEGPAGRLHQLIRRNHPASATDLMFRAGERTADHIITYRIPRVPLYMIQSAPPWLAAPLLASVINKHAWTFAGSGSFRVASKHPPVFELLDNPVVRGERAEQPVCYWHAAVFQQLFRRIVDPGFTCKETRCLAAGDDCCRFELELASPKPPVNTRC